MTATMKAKMRSAAKLMGLSLRQLEIVFAANLRPLRETDPGRADRIQAAHLDKMIAFHTEHPHISARRAGAPGAGQPT